MFRTFIWFLYFWYHLITTLPTLLKIKRLEKKGKLKEKKAVSI